MQQLKERPIGRLIAWLFPPRPAGEGEEAMPSPFRESWRAAWWVYGVGFAAIIALFWETVADTAATWYDDAAYNHGFLILPICAYLIWIRRSELAQLAPRPCWWGLVIVAGAGFGWLLGELGAVRIVQQFSVVGLMEGLFLTVFGWRIAWLLRFALFYLFLAIPFGQFMVPWLQDFTAEFAAAAVRLFGVPVFMDGLFISIPEGNFVVAEACAGVRFLIATLALGFLFAHLTYKSVWRKVIFLVLCFIVPIIANGIRAFAIVMAGHVSNMTVAVGIDHIFYGWVLFAIITLLLLWVGMLFRDREPGQSMKTDDFEPDPPGRGAKAGLLAGAAVACLAVTLVAPLYADVIADRVVQSAKVTVPVPEVGGGWRYLPGYRDSWRPQFPHADTVRIASYGKGKQTVHLAIAYFAHQRQGAEAVYFGNVPYDEKNWSRAGGGTAQAPVDGTERTVAMTRMVYHGTGRVVWHWYWIGGHHTASGLMGKLFEVRAKLLGGEQAGAYIAVATDYGDRPAEAVPVLTDFLSSLKPLSPVLAGVAAAR